MVRPGPGPPYGLELDLWSPRGAIRGPGPILPAEMCLGYMRGQSLFGRPGGLRAGHWNGEDGEERRDGRVFLWKEERDVVTKGTLEKRRAVADFAADLLKKQRLFPERCFSSDA